ncbi:MAG: TetR family transcriptional regulator [Propionicimonas sp.]|uniref:TetR/AcrR family transcriptional regulator n=1 Tax=Propionicimonas sp. TaxID=1955623 RepID=UPI003D0CB491
MPSPAGRVERSDARANRQRLLDAASELIAERGVGVTLNDIAHHAGVGVGTAYRKFANKTEVIDALFDERLAAVVALAQECLADPDAWAGFVRFLEGSLRMQAQDRGLKDVLNHPSLGGDRLELSRRTVSPLVAEIVARAQRAGALRPDVTASDVIVAQLALHALMDFSRGIEPDLYRRYLSIVLDGLRADHALTALPVAALDDDQTQAVTSNSVRLST